LNIASSSGLIVTISYLDWLARNCIDAQIIKILSLDSLSLYPIWTG
jgi:hypothetical protein